MDGKIDRLVGRQMREDRLPQNGNGETKKILRSWT